MAVCMRGMKGEAGTGTGGRGGVGGWCAIGVGWGVGVL